MQQQQEEFTEIEKLILIIEWSAKKPRFDNSTVLSIQKRFDNTGILSLKEKNAINNIWTKWRVAQWCQDSEFAY
jgi:hypothetical protein